jgi:hypothetical protein
MGRDEIRRRLAETTKTCGRCRNPYRVSKHLGTGLCDPCFETFIAKVRQCALRRMRREP